LSGHYQTPQHNNSELENLVNTFTDICGKAQKKGLAEQSKQITNRHGEIQPW